MSGFFVSARVAAGDVRPIDQRLLTSSPTIEFGSAILPFPLFVLDVYDGTGQGVHVDLGDVLGIRRGAGNRPDEFAVFALELAFRDGAMGHLGEGGGLGIGLADSSLRLKLRFALGGAAGEEAAGQQ